MKSTNMLERLNQEIKRRTQVVRIFPTPRAAYTGPRACGGNPRAWIEAMRYLNMDLWKEHKKALLRSVA